MNLPLLTIKHFFVPELKKKLKLLQIMQNAIILWRKADEGRVFFVERHLNIVCIHFVAFFYFTWSKIYFIFYFIRFKFKFNCNKWAIIRMRKKNYQFCLFVRKLFDGWKWWLYHCILMIEQQQIFYKRILEWKKL